jgi:flagellar biosynthesis/type III secretory pathway protein FliH
MSYPDLPPGVTPNMIPGNRPEDEAEERFWDELASRMGVEGDLAARAVYDQVGNDENLARVVELARDMGYEQGMQDGRAEEQMAQASEQADAPLSLALTPAVANVLLRPLRSQVESARNQRDRYRRIKDENAARGMVAEVDDLIEAFGEEAVVAQAMLELVEGVIAHGG